MNTPGSPISRKEGYEWLVAEIEFLKSKSDESEKSNDRSDYYALRNASSQIVDILSEHSVD